MFAQRHRRNNPYGPDLETSIYNHIVGTPQPSLLRRIITAPLALVRGLFMATVALAGFLVIASSIAVVAVTTMFAYAAYQVAKPILRLMAPLLRDFLITLISITDTFYVMVRLALTPLKIFNNKLEAFMIHNIRAQRISPTNARRILIALYASELIAGSSLMGAFFIAPVAALVPTSKILGAFIYSAVVSFNTLKLSSWMAERWVNFTESVRNLEWDENWAARNRMNRRILIDNAVQRMNLRNIIIPAPLPGNFDRQWKKAMETRDLSQVLNLLQGVYELDGRVAFTPEMTVAFDENRYGTSFYGADIPAETISTLESEDFCCPLSGSLMQIPVYVVASNGVKNYFDFIQLLKALETNNRNPLNREVIANLNEIKYDAEKYNAIHGLLNDARVTHPAPVLLSGSLETRGNGFNVAAIGEQPGHQEPGVSEQAYRMGYGS
jgi:hypothetical protein